MAVTALIHFLCFCTAAFLKTEVVEGALRKSGRDHAFLAAQDSEHLLCNLGPTDGFNGSVQVWVDTRQNTRALTFNGDGLGEQTLITCKGFLSGEACNSGRGTSELEALTSAAAGPNCDTVDCPCDADSSSLQFGYMVKMMDELSGPCALATGGGERFRVLLIGLGGGALPNYLLDHCPSADVESVEYDPRVVDVATRFFGVRTSPGHNSVENNDGGAAVADRAAQGEGRYDAILVDCFQSGGKVPESCSSDAFINNARKILKGGGRVVQQIWSPQYEDVIKHYRKSFGETNVKGTDIELGINHLIIASKAASSDLALFSPSHIWTAENAY